MSFLYVIIGLFALYLTNRRMTLELSRLIHRLGGNQNVVIWIWSIIFLPGTIIHEISHFLAAAVTNARTGKVEILPEFIEDILDEEEGERNVRLGSVQVQRLNPLQGFLVGMAPFISGSILLVWLASLMRVGYLSGSFYSLALQTYLFFVISNSFFPSWTDIKQTLPLITLAIIVVLITWFFGFQFTVNSLSPIWEILDAMTKAILISNLLNLVIVGALSLLNIKRHRRY